MRHYSVSLIKLMLKKGGVDLRGILHQWDVHWSHKLYIASNLCTPWRALKNKKRG